MNLIKQFLAKHRKNIIILSTILLVIVQVVNLVYITSINVTSNDECLWIVKEGGQTGDIYFDKVKVGGVTWNAGIRNGDRLLAINGEKLNATFQAQAILNQIKSGDYASYTIKKGNNTLDTKVYIKKLINFPNLGFGLLGIFWLLVGFIVVLAKPNGFLQRIFYNIGAAFVLMVSLVIIIGNNTLPRGMVYVVDLIWSFAACFLPFLIIHFYWLFPRPFNFVKKLWVRRTLYIVPSIIYVISVIIRASQYYGRNNADGKANLFYVPFANFLNFLVITSLCIGVVSLLINYIRIKEKSERKPLFIILTANLFGVISILYVIFLAPVISDTIFNSPEFYAPIIFVSIIPIAFGISIFRYQLMDVSAVIKNTIIYGAATLTVAALYFLIIYSLGEFISRAIGTEYQGIIAGVIFIVFAMVFQSTKDKFQEFITEKFYPEQFAYQKVLIKFSNDISVVVGLDNILDAMKNTLVESLKIKEFAIMIREGNESFVMERSVGCKDCMLALDNHNLNKFIQKKHSIDAPVVAEQSDFEDIFPEDHETLKQNSIYTVIPLIIKSKVIGFLMFGLKHSGSQFAGKDLELLTAAANQAAISIENARLYRSEAEKVKIERDLDLARKIQQSLLPKCLPSLNGLDICGQMVPAMQVGGDYFDLIPLPDNKLFVVVGDVSGKGLSASLYMTKLQTMMQLACVSGKTPKEILFEVNRKLYLSIEKDWFVTMSLSLFDLDAKTVKTCRAGHVPLLLANNGTVKPHRSMGIGVGLEKGIIFEKTLVEEEISLTPGKIFVFYSDGITEAMNEHNELFGEDNLCELLRNKGHVRSSDLMNEIWDQIKVFRGKAEQNDDMTMVLVRVSNKNEILEPSC